MNLLGTLPIGLSQLVSIGTSGVLSGQGRTPSDGAAEPSSEPSLDLPTGQGRTFVTTLLSFGNLTHQSACSPGSGLLLPMARRFFEGWAATFDDFNGVAATEPELKVCALAASPTSVTWTKRLPVHIPRWKHPFPFRTRQLSSLGR